MKKTLLLLLLSAFVLSASAAAPTVTEKVRKAFDVVFPGVEGAKWYDYENFYEAYFEKDGIKCRVRFNRDAEIMSTIRYYGEQQLSPFLRAKLAQRFPDKKLFGVTEVSSDTELTYHVILEDDKSWTHVKCDSLGGLEVTDKFKKSEK